MLVPTELLDTDRIVFLCAGVQCCMTAHDARVCNAMHCSVSVCSCIYVHCISFHSANSGEDRSNGLHNKIVLVTDAGISITGSSHEMLR